MAQLFEPGLVPAFDSNGRVISGAQLHFYLSGTTTRVSVFTTPDETVAHSNPVLANSAGRFTPVYLRENVIHRVRVTDKNGTLLPHSDVDPVNAFTPEVPTVRYYRLAGFAVAPPLTEEVLAEHIATDSFTLPADMVGSFGNAGSSPMAPWTLDVQRNGVSVGSITFATDGDATFATIANEPVSITEGDVLSFIAPVEPDPMIERLRYTLKGVL